MRNYVKMRICLSCTLLTGEAWQKGLLIMVIESTHLLFLFFMKEEGKISRKHLDD